MSETQISCVLSSPAAFCWYGAPIGESALSWYQHLWRILCLEQQKAERCAAPYIGLCYRWPLHYDVQRTITRWLHPVGLLWKLSYEVADIPTMRRIKYQDRMKIGWQSPIRETNFAVSIEVFNEFNFKSTHRIAIICGWFEHLYRFRIKEAPKSFARADLIKDHE